MDSPETESRAHELKRYVRFNEKDARALASFSTTAAPHFRRIATEFYERAREHEGAHAVFQDEAQVKRLHESMVAWLERVFGGTYDESYFGKTAIIGRVHVDVGLPQRYMTSAMALVRSSLTTLILEAKPNAEGFAIADALSRLLDIELAVMLDAYSDDYIRRIQSSMKRDALEGVRRATAAEEHSVKAIELTPVVVIGLSSNGSILLFNRAAERTTGYAQDEVLSRTFADLFLPKDAAVRRSLLAQLEVGDGEAIETPLLTRAKQSRTFRWRTVQTHHRDENDTAFFLFGADVTKEVSERQWKEQERRLAGLGRLASGLAHEIRNPLNGARLHVALLQRWLKRRAQTQPMAATDPALTDAADAVDVVDRETQRLAHLVTDFLDYAEPRPVLSAPKDIRPVCLRAIEVVASAAKEAGTKITADLPTAPLVLASDERRLERVIVSLLENAIESASGGDVTLRARRDPDRVWIEVEDDGPGLPAGNPPIFEAFFSTKPSGTGLGLAIVHRIVTDHGGTVDVDSQPGATRFRVNLPLSPAGIESKQEPDIT